MNSYEHRALLYSERYGILDYRLIDKFMVWEEHYPTEGSFRYTLDLDTMETDVRQIKKGRYD